MTEEIKTMQMVVTKASYDKETGERRIRMVASDTSPDYFDERMSVQLFNSFIAHIEEPVEGVWRSVMTEKGWKGGMPYTSVSHYPSGKGGANIPADVKSVYVDGDRLKSIAVARNTPLGNKLWEALKADLDGTSEYEEKIRVSIGFIDLMHSHDGEVFVRDTLETRCAMCENGVGNKVYLDGILVHLAFTRVPANPNTSAEVEKMAEINTRKEDAQSIVGDLAEELEVNKSLVSDVLVTKDENEEASEQVDTVSAEEPVVEEVEEVVEETNPAPVEEPAPQEVPAIFDEPKSALDLALESFKSKVTEMKSLSRDEALTKLQEEFETLADVVRSEFPEPTPEEKTVDTLKTLLDKVEELIQSNKSLTEEVAILKAQKPVANKPDEAPVRRSIVSREPIQTIPETPMKISEIARKSVGLG